MIFTIAFWKGAGERLIKTFLQAGIAAFLGTLGLGATTGTGFNALANLGVLDQAAEIGAGFGLGAAILSLCTSLGNAQFTAGTPAAVLGPPAVTPAPVVNVNTVPAAPVVETVEPGPLETEPASPTPAENDAADEEDPASEPEPTTA